MLLFQEIRRLGDRLMGYSTLKPGENENARRPLFSCLMWMTMFKSIIGNGT
jgi:hypothetical protein